MCFLHLPAQSQYSVVLFFRSSSFLFPTKNALKYIYRQCTCSSRSSAQNTPVYLALVLRITPSYFCWNHFIASSLVRRCWKPTWPVLRRRWVTLKPAETGEKVDECECALVKTSRFSDQNMHKFVWIWCICTSTTLIAVLYLVARTSRGHTATGTHRQPFS